MNREEDLVVSWDTVIDEEVYILCEDHILTENKVDKGSNCLSERRVREEHF